MRLFSYCVPIDNGHAPNPYGGYCTLAVCKPAIRRAAEIGHLIAGTGSKRFRLDGKLIYAMRITNKLSFEEYDEWARTECKIKVPDWNAHDTVKQVGDCQYYRHNGRWRQRPGVHPISMAGTDLSGKYVLISNDFVYFGKNAIIIPKSLSRICHQQQHHLSNSISDLVKPFEKWFERLKQMYRRNSVNGYPQL